MLQKPAHIPHAPGIYRFIRGGTILYIGKAGDLQKRLSSYWRKKAGAKVESLLREADHVEWILLESEVEALIKEAELIKTHIPKYNVVLRDDKSYFYAAITREMFPKIFISHYPKKSLKKNKGTKDKKIKYIGPFTSGTALKTVMRFIRNIFPYCTCFRPHKRPCLNAQIGRCPGYCCLIPTRESHITNHEEYKKNIQNSISILQGKKPRLVSKLKKEMRHTARNQQFEKAAKIRDQIEGLENIFLHTPTLDGQKAIHVKRNWNTIQAILQNLLGTTSEIRRVEGYDISNISGTEATGSMVVFENGKPKKSDYRKFRIRRVQEPNDFAMMQEVVARRLQHPEWHYPDLMLIDGGKPQLNIVMKIVLEKTKQLGIKKTIMVAGLAKREEELYMPGRITPVPLRTLPRETEFFLEHVRNESHRFAKKYHHKLREIKYRQKTAGTFENPL